AVGRGTREGVEDQREVVAADVAHERRQRVVRQVGERRVERAIDRAGGTGDEGFAQRAGRRAKQSMILRLRARFEPRAEAPVLLERSAPAQLDHVPAAGGEQRRELAWTGVRRDAIEALTVDVDD